MKEMIIVLLILFALVLFVMLRGAYDEKKRKQQYRRTLQSMYGSFSQSEYSIEELIRIESSFKHFLKANPGTNHIDDITWNDLNMTAVFSRMNFTQSSAGAKQLYTLLRCPRLSDADGSQKKMEKHIVHLMSDENTRLDALMLLNELGKSGKYTLTDYLEYIKGLGTRSNLKHYICIILLLLSVVSVFVNPVFGVIFLIIAACMNIVIYINEKSIAATYIAAFSYIMRIIACADGILELKLGDKFDIYINELKRKRNVLRKFEKNAKMTMKLNSATVSAGGILFDYVKMLTHIDIIQFNNMLSTVCENEKDIYDMESMAGYLDAVISIGYFRAALEYYCVPVMINGKNDTLVIKDGFHPCMENAVSNSIMQNRGMLVTGSNASGKSTFLKMTAINAIMAQGINTCCAKAYSGNYYRIYSSMSLHDNLEQGDSYYMVEIKALKRITDAASVESPNPLLCFVDEVLRGTNTVERIAASVQILKKLSLEGIYCFAATHDIELTHLLENEYDNYHFQEDVKNGDVLFSYRLMRGRAHTRNAIRLLEIIGFSKDIVQKADDMAGRFLKSGEWRDEEDYRR